MRQNLRPISVALLLLATASTMAYARDSAKDSAAVPQVRGQMMNGFARLTFEWPEPTLFTAKTDGNDLILSFDRKSNPNMGVLLKQLAPYITKAQRKADGKTIVLTLNEPHRIRTFISDNVSGIDLLDVKGGAKPQAAKQIAMAEPEEEADAAEPKPLLKHAKPAKEKTAAAKKDTKPTKLAAKERGLDLAGLEPAAGEAQEAPKPTIVKNSAVKTTPAEELKEAEAPKPLDALKEAVAQSETKAPKETGAAAAAEPAKEAATEANMAAAKEAEPVTEPAAKPAEEAPKTVAEEKPAEEAPQAKAEEQPAPAPEKKEAAAEKPEEKPQAKIEPAAQDTGKKIEIKEEAKAESAPVPQGEIAAKEAPKQEAKDSKAAEPKKEAAKNADGEEERSTLHHDTGISMVPMTVDAAASPQEEPAEETAKAVKDDVPGPIEAGELATPLTTNKIVISADTDGATLRFPLKERTAMALFIRVNTLWVVFDKKLDFDLSEFDSLPQTVINKATLVPNDKATVLRIPINDNIFPEVKQQEGQLDIAVILTPKKTEPSAPMTISINTELPELPNVFVSALEVGNTVEVDDPDIGDTLLVTPVYTREQGIANHRDFVEFSLLASQQGLVIAKKADNTEVVPVRGGLRVSLPKGASLSPEVAGSQPVQKVIASNAQGTLFPADMWALEKNKNPKIAMRNLINQSVFASTEGGKNLARLRMAQLFLNDGYVVEALGLLNTIQKASPAYYRSAKLAAMRGAANFLLYRFNDAAADFGAAELNNNIEVSYWRDMLADLLGNPGKVNNFLDMNDHYISKYPAVFRQRLAIVAADRAIAAKEYNSALKIFETLSKDSIIAPIQSYVDFLTAKISAENGQEQDAMEVWKRLSQDDSNRFVQARAKFSMILYELDNNIITREEAMDQLERLRLGWHGDGLELQVVQLLGELYYDKHDYVNAMRVWQIGVTGYPNTGPSVEMARKMEDTFIRLFNEGIADKMTPLEALALYYEYRNYTPPGATGTQMIEKLADRLVGVDLLSTAAQLLEQQMRTQMEKAERSRIGAKLADIYLLNNQPKRAMKALQDSVYGDNPILQRVKRNQLTAKAMMQLGRPQEALSVLGQDESIGAEKLRAMIYWNEKDWPNITSSIESMFKKREDPSAPLNAEEGEYAVRLALSYVFQNDQQQLQYMRDYFGPLLVGNPYDEAFNFVTTPDIRLNTRNFDDLLQTLSNTRGFINTYKARMELADSNPPPAQP